MSNRAVTVLLFLRRVDCNDGVASYIEAIVKGLRSRGLRTVIVSGPVTQHYGSVTRRNAILENVLEWLVIDDLRANRPTLASIRSIVAAIKKYAVDVISPQGFSLVPFSYLLKMLTGRRMVVNYHPSMPGKSLGNIATSRSIKTKLSFRAISTVFPADCYIAISKDIEAFYSHDCRIPSRRIAYIPHGIDMSFFRQPTEAEKTQSRQTFSLSDDELTCILPGRLNFDKGHDVAVEAIRILRDRYPQLKVVCLFPGGGDHSNEIRHFAFKSDADHSAFRFLGFLDAQTFREAFWAADIGLLPSRFEGFGLVVAEAMSCGCVPIRTPSGGWQDQIVDGINGYLIPFDDSVALADRIAKLSDSSVRRTMRERAISFALEHFDKETMISTTGKLYTDITHGAR